MTGTGVFPAKSKFRHSIVWVGNALLCSTPVWVLANRAVAFIGQDRLRARGSPCSRPLDTVRGLREKAADSKRGEEHHQVKINNQAINKIRKVFLLLYSQPPPQTPTKPYMVRELWVYFNMLDISQEGTAYRRQVQPVKILRRLCC